MNRKPIRPNRETEEELVTAIEWYEREQPGLGRELWVEVQKTVELIGTKPSAGAAVTRSKASGIRRMPLRRFPYFIFYRERPTEIHILAFAHMSRRPGYWRRRR